MAGKKNSFAWMAGLAVLTSFSSVSAATWYVDDDNYGKADLDGKTEATAFGTLQDAMDNTGLNTGDVVLVLPGVYTNGMMVTLDAQSRMVVNKSVKIVSKEGKDVTHIVGAPDPSTGSCGPNAVRCIGVTHMAPNAEIRGFTIRDGYTANTTSNNKRGGGVCVNNDTAWIIDCVISNCTSEAAAMYRGNAYRTWFTGNRSSVDSGYSVCHSSKLHTCLVSGNVPPVKYLMHMGCAVNTTLALNAPSSMGVAGRCFGPYRRQSALRERILPLSSVVSVPVSGSSGSCGWRASGVLEPLPGNAELALTGG